MFIPGGNLFPAEMQAKFNLKTFDDNEIERTNENLTDSWTEERHLVSVPHKST